MRVRHRLEPATARGVRMNELRLDGSRPDQRDLNDDVVQPVRQRMQYRRDLRATLDLERSNSLAATDELVRLRITLRQPVHLRPLTGTHLDVVERSPHQRHRAQ